MRRPGQYARKASIIAYVTAGISLTSLLVFTLVTLHSQVSHASGVPGWNAGRIIDDMVFTNSSTMSAGQIQEFLNSKVPNCDTNGQQPSEYGGGTRAQWGAAHGHPAPFVCLKDYSESGETAAQIIYNAAQNFRINPQVLLVLLQKEQGLVTDTWPIDTQYKTATGYGCPDTAACDSQYYGLKNQVRWASRMFRAIMDNSPTWYTPYILGNNYIQYNPTQSCGGSNVNIQNRATQSLYNYTPYQPNQGALDAGWGTASCGAYGNRNFYLYFTQWFGSTQTSTPYAWSLDSQQAYADSGRTQPFTDTISLSPGQKAYLRIKARNVGYNAWDKSNVRLGASRPKDRSSGFASNDWLSANRIQMVESNVAVGEVGTFEFTITAPQKTGSYDEYFTPLREGMTWMNDIGLYYPIDVVTTQQAPNTTNTGLASGATLNTGEYLLSPDTQSTLNLQPDGNLVVYSSYKARWSSITYGNPDTKRLTMQNDGNLVIYKNNGDPVWSSGTVGNPGAYLRLQTDGNLVIYSNSGSALWSTNSFSTPDYLHRVSKALPTGVMYKGQSLKTADGTYTLLFQNDGNLVIYSPTRATWATGIVSDQVANVVMQSDGNLVIYSKSGSPLWNSRTNGRGASALTMQNDGNLVLYGGAGPTWASGTPGVQ